MKFMAKLKGGLGPAVNRGHIYTMVVAIVVGVLDATYNHLYPSTAAQHASEASDQAVQKAGDSAAKSAVIEVKVAEHTQELGNIAISMADLKMSVAVLQSQATEAKATADKMSDKEDKILEAVYLMRGAQRAANSPTPR